MIIFPLLFFGFGQSSGGNTRLERRANLSGLSSPSRINFKSILFIRIEFQLFFPTKSCPSLISIELILAWVISVNQPKLCPHASWNPNAITFVDNITIGTHPFSLFINTKNTIFTARHDNGRILIWRNASIHPTTTILAHLSSPWGLFVSEDEQIFANDSQVKERVDRWTSNGTRLASPMSVCSPCVGLFVDEMDNLYCSQGSGHQVLRRSLQSSSSELTIVGGMGCPGSAPNMLNNPRGIFVTTDLDLYVVDDGNNRVQLFRRGELNATTVQINGWNGTITLNGPTDVTLDADGISLHCRMWEESSSWFWTWWVSMCGWLFWYEWFSSESTSLSTDDDFWPRRKSLCHGLVQQSNSTVSLVEQFLWSVEARMESLKISSLSFSDSTTTSSIVFTSSLSGESRMIIGKKKKKTKRICSDQPTSPFLFTSSERSLVNQCKSQIQCPKRDLSLFSFQRVPLRCWLWFRVDRIFLLLSNFDETKIFRCPQPLNWIATILLHYTFNGWLGIVLSSPEWGWGWRWTSRRVCQRLDPCSWESFPGQSWPVFFRWAHRWSPVDLQSLFNWIRVSSLSIPMQSTSMLRIGTINTSLGSPGCRILPISMVLSCPSLLLRTFRVGTVSQVEKKEKIFFPFVCSILSLWNEWIFVDGIFFAYSPWFSSRECHLSIPSSNPEQTKQCPTRNGVFFFFKSKRMSDHWSSSSEEQVFDERIFWSL